VAQPARRRAGSIGRVTAIVAGDTRRVLPGLLVLAAAVVAGVGIALAADFVALVAFSAVSAVVCRPLQLRLRRRGWPAWAALVVTIGLYVLVLSLLGLAGLLSLVALAAQLPNYTDRLQGLIDVVANALGDTTGAVPGVDARALVGVVTTLLGSVLSVALSLAFAVLVVIYLLLDGDRLRVRMLAATSADTMARYDALARELVAYAKERTLLGGAAAILNTVLLLLVGVPFALLWGLVSFVFSFVPNIGFIAALIPPTLLALLELGPGAALLVVAGFVAINLLFDYVLQPRVMGAELGLSAVLIILAIIAWSGILGLVGALLAVPLTIALRALLLPFPGAAWAVALLGGAHASRRQDGAGDDQTAEALDDAGHAPDTAPAPEAATIKA